MTSYPPPPQSGRETAEQGAAPSAPAGVPAYPAYPAGDGQGLAVERPASVSNAVRLMWAGAAASAASLVYGLVSRGSVRDNIRQSLIDQKKLTPSNLDTAYHTVIVIAVIVGLLSIGLWLWMAHLNGQGRKWARIVATVLGGLSIISFLATLAQGEATGVNIVLSAIIAVLAVIILVLLWSRQANAFFDERSRRHSR